MRQARKKMSITEFEPLTIIGRGAFGEVRVCRQISTGDIVAVKKMRKEDMLNKNQLMHVRTEKEIMTASNPWIVKLKYSFQDEFFLYLVMDFLPGGDLMNLLMKKEILSEDEARFYTAEMVLAVDSVHKLNCIHRDLKPDNILIDKYGHIQLSDFGLAKISDKTFFPLTVKDNQTPKKLINTPADSITTISTNINTNSNKNTNINISKLNIKSKNNLKKLPKKNRLIAYSTVGTPDYIAPEVFSQNGYGEEADWWSIGVMFFEMVVGFPPFFSENPSDTCKKIVKWKEHFSIPSDANLSPEAESFILRMVSPAETRLGINGVEEIKKHPFFKGIDWNNIRKMKAPFIPELKNDYDTHYFDTFQEQEPFYPPTTSSKGKQRKDVNYAGYTFNRDNENIKDSFVQALEVLEAVEKTSANKKNKEIITDINSPDIYKINEEKKTNNKKTENSIKINNINNNGNKIKINNIKENIQQNNNTKENNIQQNNNKEINNKQNNNNIILNNPKNNNNTNNNIILNNPRNNNNNNNPKNNTNNNIILNNPKNNSHNNNTNNNITLNNPRNNNSHNNNNHNNNSNNNNSNSHNNNSNNNHNNNSNNSHNNNSNNSHNNNSNSHNNNSNSHNNNNHNNNNSHNNNNHNNIIRLNNNSGGKNSQNRNTSKNKEKIININSKSKEKDTKIIKMNKSKEKDSKVININSKSKEKDSKIITINSKSKEKDNNKVVTVNNKSKEKDPKIINSNNKSKEKDNKVIILNNSKGKEIKKINNINSKSKGKETPSENVKEPTLQKNLNSNNKISINKNIKEVKKGNKSPNPGNGIIKKKIIISNPKQKQGPVIKISPNKIPKEKVHSAKVRVNTENNSDIKKPTSKQGQKPVKTVIKRKIEKSPNPNMVINKK